MTFVEYKITGEFGLLGIGEVTTAVKIVEDPDSGIALLFHPQSEEDSVDCASFEFAMIGKDGYWVSCSDLFVNIPEY